MTDLCIVRDQGFLDQQPLPQLHSCASHSAHSSPPSGKISPKKHSPRQLFVTSRLAAAKKQYLRHDHRHQHLLLNQQKTLDHHAAKKKGKSRLERNSMEFYGGLNLPRSSSTSDSRDTKPGSPPPSAMAGAYASAIASKSAIENRDAEVRTYKRSNTYVLT